MAKNNGGLSKLSSAGKKNNGSLHIVGTGASGGVTLKKAIAMGTGADGKSMKGIQGTQGRPPGQPNTTGGITKKNR